MTPHETSQHSQIVADLKTWSTKCLNFVLPIFFVPRLSDFTSVNECIMQVTKRM